MVCCWDAWWDAQQAWRKGLNSVPLLEMTMVHSKVLKSVQNLGCSRAQLTALELVECLAEKMVGSLALQTNDQLANSKGLKLAPLCVDMLVFLTVVKSVPMKVGKTVSTSAEPTGVLLVVKTGRHWAGSSVAQRAGRYFDG